MKIYTLDPRCIPAMEKVREYYLSIPEWQKDIREGKMFGVLIYSPTNEGPQAPPQRTPPQPSHKGREYNVLSNHQYDVTTPLPCGGAGGRVLPFSFLAAFSGTLGGKTCQPGFVPPIFDIQGEGRYFLEEEAEISAINHYLDSGKASAREVCDLRHERKERSRALQRWLFARYSLLNVRGDSANLLDIFSPTIPPGGAGDCCAPKLLQEAFRRGIRPLAIAEWNSADNKFYPPCTHRCRPILAHMLQGTDAEADPELTHYQDIASRLKTIYEDKEIIVVNKPSGLLSVPGKEFLPSVESITQALSTHRLDQDTSGLLVLAKTENIQKDLRQQFAQRAIEKTYDALLEQEMPVGKEGVIELPLRPDIENRPRQIVDHEHGKSALTHYRVIGNINGHAHLLLTPETGRTHQLRMHCAEGLKNPILGDRLYGTREDATSQTLRLNASAITITHPTTGEKMRFTCTPEWLGSQD